MSEGALCSLPGAPFRTSVSLGGLAAEGSAPWQGKSWVFPWVSIYRAGGRGGVFSAAPPASDPRSHLVLRLGCQRGTRGGQSRAVPGGSEGHPGLHEARTRAEPLHPPPPPAKPPAPHLGTPDP